jgi:hypothetical protein
MTVLRYKEWLTILPSEVFWVYDMCEEMPKWDIVKQKYIFKKKPKRITAQKAKEIIKEHGLSCVCNNEHGRIYA